jgi:hypothetical protein
MSRIGRGWALAKQSFRILRADGSLVAFPIVSAIAGGIVAVLLFGPGAILYAADRQEAWLVVFGVLAVYGLTFVTVFFNTALAAAAARSLAGQDTSLGDGLRVARQSVGAIAAWTLVQGTVGLLLNLPEKVNDVIAEILAAVLNFAWGAVTFFVVPVLALEGVGPRAAFTRSVALLRQRWGEGVVGSAAIGGLVALVALLPILALGFGGAALLQSAPVAGAVLIALAALVLIAALVIGGTLSAIFRVALYRFAVDGEAVGGFDTAALQNAFVQRRRRWRRSG